MKMKIGKKDCRDLDRALGLEWLETNGRRGFASGTVSGANTRRYHGLVLTAQQLGTNRYVLVNHVEEWLHIAGEPVSLSTNLYPGTVHPQGYTHCASLVSTPWPKWIYTYKRKKIQREILCIRGRNIVLFDGS